MIATSSSRRSDEQLADRRRRLDARLGIQGPLDAVLDCRDGIEDGPARRDRRATKLQQRDLAREHLAAVRRACTPLALEGRGRLLRIALGALGSFERAARRL